MPRIYVDASVLIAALLSSTGASAAILNIIRSKRAVGIISQTVINEVLAHEKKIGKSSKIIQEFLLIHGFLVRRRVTKEDVAPYRGSIDPEDAHLVAAAISTRCDCLVTLDKKHLLNPIIKKRFLPLRILSPKELLKEFT